jgi:hypothetical protein
MRGLFAVVLLHNVVSVLCFVNISPSRNALHSRGISSQPAVLYAVKEKKKTTTALTKDKTLVKERKQRNGWPQLRRHREHHEHKEDSHHRNVSDQLLSEESNQTALVMDGNATSNVTASGLENMVQAAEDVVQLMEEFNKRIEDGSNEMLGNLTSVMEKKLDVLPKSELDDLPGFLANLTNQIQKAQRMEMERQAREFETMFVRPLEDFAFSDAAANKNKKRQDDVPDRERLVLSGENSTLRESSRRMRTSEIIRNLNVAPFYYSVALLQRWFRKLSYPPMILISMWSSLAKVVQSHSPQLFSRKGEEGQTYEEYIHTAEVMQAGWKRTGEIAAKGSWARKWAILRRSAEIWAYFSSFYIKEKRAVSRFNSGRWSQERFSKERSKLGAEVTQNLLKLGPTFIKASRTLSLLDVAKSGNVRTMMTLTHGSTNFLLHIGWTAVLDEDRHRPEGVY